MSRVAKTLEIRTSPHLISGYDADNPEVRYDRTTWTYELDDQGYAKVDDTLQHPRCVLNLLKTHVDRYTPEQVHELCGTPVAAFPVSGPLDVLRQGVSGVMDEDLQRACLQALQLDRRACAEEARRQSWQASALEFLARQPRLDGVPCLSGEPLRTERAAP